MSWLETFRAEAEKRNAQSRALADELSREIAQEAEKTRKERLAAYQREYYRKHKAQFHAYYLKRRAAKKGA